MQHAHTLREAYYSALSCSAVPVSRPYTEQLLTPGIPTVFVSHRFQQIKYLEIANVCNDFLETAKHLATTIIDERNFELVDKTIRPVIESACNGRGVEGNRGHAGKRYKYEAFNIRLKVCCDDHGLFNGDDECAAKGYGGRGLLGALEYMKQHEPGETNLGSSSISLD